MQSTPFDSPRFCQLGIFIVILVLSKGRTWLSSVNATQGHQCPVDGAKPCLSCQLGRVLCHIERRDMAVSRKREREIHGVCSNCLAMGSHTYGTLAVKGSRWETSAPSSKARRCTAVYPSGYGSIQSSKGVLTLALHAYLYEGQGWVGPWEGGPAQLS